MQYVCLNCISDPFLRDALPTGGDSCDFCDEPGPSARISDLALECDRVIDALFETTHREPSVLIYDRPPKGMDLRDTLALLNFSALCSKQDQILDEVIEYLNFLWFDRDSFEHKHSGDDYLDEPYFRLRSNLGGGLSDLWAQMQESLQHEARFQNATVTRFLHKALGHVHQDLTSTGRPAVVEAGPNTSLTTLYRARVFEAESKLVEALEHPARLLGTPARGVGAPGRMNSRGQPTFYGATTTRVAIAEVRPPVGAWVATAAFDIARTLRLLDLRDLANLQIGQTQSFFDPRTVLLAERRDFLRQLVEQITRPVMPEQQDRDYLVTQVIADYLATHRRGPLDGIIYPSAQVPADENGSDSEYNVALFPRASRVSGAEGDPLGMASLWEWEDDGPGRYVAPELVIRLQKPDGRHSPAIATSHLPSWQDALQLALASITVHRVEGVQVTTRSYPVRISDIDPSEWRRR